MFRPPPPASGVSFHLADLDPSIPAATAVAGRRIEPSLRDGNLRSCFPGRGGLGGASETTRVNRVETFRRIRMGSWNVGSLTGKLLELADALERHKVDIACFQETKWKGSSNREGNGYKIWYSGSPTAKNEVGIILKACLKDKVVQVNRCSDRIISLTLVIDGETVNVINAYAPQVGLIEVEKKAFWDSLDKVVKEFPTDQRLIVGGGLNGHTGATTEGYAGVYGGFGYGVRNEEGRAILDFAIAHDLVVVNLHFKKRDHHLVTFQSGGRRTQIDYLLVQRGDLKACKDCRVFPREACSSQHSLLALDFLFKSVQRRREGSALPRILWKNLIGDATEAFRSRVGEGISTRVKALAACDADSMWNTLAIAVKQARFRELLLCQEGNEEERLRAHERYKEAKRQAKKVIAQAKEKAYEDLYKKLDSKERANDIFRIAKAKERRKRDTWDICFIKDEEGRTITDEEEIRKRWGEYFSSLFNARAREGQEEGVGPSRQPHPECYFSRISQAEVKTALQKMGRNKVVGPNQIPIEAWRCLGDEGTFWLTSLFNKIFTGAKMPEEWRLSKVIPIFKNKGDAQVCSNYRGIKLLGHTMKLWERVIERRLQRETLVSKNQFGFMPGRSSVEAIHLIRSLMEKYRKRQRDLHMAFLDLEKAYDSVPRELIWKTLVDKGASRRYIKVIRDMYDGAKTRREVLEDNDLRVSREKTEYLRCDFGNGEIAQNEDVDICIGDKILQPKESFRYLGSMLHKFGRIDEDVSSRIKAAWMKWRAATGVLCVWTLRDMIPNRVYRVQLKVETIINKMREGRLRWFGHVRRRSQSTPVRRVKDLVVDGLRRRGKPKLRWEDRVKQDMKELLLSEDMTSDRITASSHVVSLLCVFVLCDVALEFVVEMSLDGFGYFDLRLRSRSIGFDNPVQGTNPMYHGRTFVIGRVFDFPMDEPEPHPSYDFFALGPLPGYAGNPNNNNGWIEADVALLGEDWERRRTNIPPPSTYEVGGLSIAAAKGHSFALLAHDFPVPPVRD
ncbi:retrovirus-related pol polyprotein LINE-1 [Tanacetum coccineum]|uniref:Retrovirus-related pol polyprotein LINE-1 n=1 Tax=Tanacetum coccineum TaxID=301880 RepID=A0ABQ5DB90_9ASTR